MEGACLLSSVWKRSEGRDSPSPKGQVKQEIKGEEWETYPFTQPQTLQFTETIQEGDNFSACHSLKIFHNRTQPQLPLHLFLPVRG